MQPPAIDASHVQIAREASKDEMQTVVSWHPAPVEGTNTCLLETADTPGLIHQKLSASSGRVEGLGFRTSGLIHQKLSASSATIL